MKTINMIPQEVMRAKYIKKTKKGAIYFVVFSIGAVLSMSHYLNLVEMNIENLEQQLSDSQSIKQQITQTEAAIKEVMEVQDFTSKNTFPYHRFFFELTTDLPEDMRIVSIQTKDTIKTENEEGQEEKMSVDTEKQPSETNAETDKATEIETVPNPLPGAKDTTTTDETTIATPEETTEKEVSNTNQTTSASIFSEDNTIYVKGYNLYPDSIAIFAERLRNNSYITSIKVTRVDNYNLGFSNLKFFELEIKGK